MKKRQSNIDPSNLQQQGFTQYIKDKLAGNIKVQAQILGHQSNRSKKTIMALRYQLIETLINRVKRPNFWFELVIVTLFLLSFAPVSYWFAENTLSETRIFHSLITLSLAIILLYRFESPTIKNALK